MLPRKLDITIASKMINLVPELSGTDKRVCAAIIDHFNCKTTQCDPSLDRIAWFLGVNRRTVIRSVSRLEMIGVLRRLRHGGHLQRNSYEPVWRQFRELEANGGSGSTRKIAVSLNEICHLASVTLSTFLVPNLSPKLFQSTNPKKVRQTMTFLKKMSESSRWPAKSKRRNIKANQFLIVGVLHPESGTPPSAEVRRTAAERRWTKALHNHFSSSSEVYGEVIGAIDQEMISAATAAEMDRRGAGIAYILEQLRAQGLQELLGSA